MSSDTSSSKSSPTTQIKAASVWSLAIGAVLFFIGMGGVGWYMFLHLKETFQIEPFEAARTTATLLGVPSAAAAIYVSLRSQRVKEQQLHADRLRLDSTERQLTHTIQTEATRTDTLLRGELRGRFTAASQQVGDSAPAVRLAGLNGLSHLADDWIEQRQACVDVICAYLRMPPLKEADSDEYNRTELEVRLSAQRLIAKGLRRRRQTTGATCTWSDVSIDLRGAVLINADFSKVFFPKDADFSNATFRGSASFEESNFEREGRFKETVFEGTASFRKARMHIALFDSAVFCSNANFRFTTAKGARFGSSVFEQSASFEDFRGKLTLQNVSFGSKPVLPKYEVMIASTRIDGVPIPDCKRVGAPQR